MQKEFFCSFKIKSPKPKSTFTPKDLKLVFLSEIIISLRSYLFVLLFHPFLHYDCKDKQEKSNLIDRYEQM